jgi:hypothetical protein
MIWTLKEAQLLCMEDLVIPLACNILHIFIAAYRLPTLRNVLNAGLHAGAINTPDERRIFNELQNVWTSAVADAGDRAIPHVDRNVGQ